MSRIVVGWAWKEALTFLAIMLPILYCLTGGFDPAIMFPNGVH